MNGENDIEQSLRTLRWDIPADVDKRILHEGRRAFEKASGDSRSGTLRILRGPWRKAVAASLSAAAAVLAVMAFTARPSVTLADVKAAVESQAWVHTTYDTGSEFWTSLRDGRHFFKKPATGSVSFTDHLRNIRQTYRPSSGFIAETPIAVYGDPKPPPWKPQTAWGAEFGYLERAMQRGADIERHTETVDGRRLVRFDCYYTDALDQRRLRSQTWADSETRLPVRYRGMVHVGKGKDMKLGWIEGKYDFPSTGPTSIYDLGVPRDIKIARVDQDGSPQEASALIEAGRQARSRWPERWRLVVWSDKESEIYVVYCDGRPNYHPRRMPDFRGVRSRHARYSNCDPRYPKYHLPMPATVDQVLSWASRQLPRQVYLTDGEKDYTRSETGAWPPMFRKPDDLPTLRITRGGMGVPGVSSFFRFRWPAINVQGPFKILSDPTSAVPPDVGIPGVILLRGGAGNTRQDYYIDPQKDHICVRLVRWDLREGAWEKNRDYEFSDLAQLPGGHWYPRRKRMLDHGGLNRGKAPREVAWNLNVKVLAVDEFPPDIFDAEKFVAEAKKQGAKITVE